jgi:RimJ/RimL family protein N-acetyltransferase
MMRVPTLEDCWIALEPIAETHREPLRLAPDDQRIWTTTIVRAASEAFDAWFDALLAERATSRWYLFAVRRTADRSIVGSTSYLDISQKHRRLEIGATWYRPDTWGSMVNPECKLLLLTHAFEVLDVQRVAFITDVRNLHSQAAIAKLGATREGVFRSQGGWPVEPEQVSESS